MTGGGGGSATDGGSCTGQPPVPQLTACSPAQLANDPDCRLGPTMTSAYNHSAINPMVITLSGVLSSGPAPVKEYRFTLFPPVPGGATSMALANNGQRTMQHLAELTVPSSVTGTFRIGLEVWDDCGAKSSTTEVIVVNVYP